MNPLNLEEVRQYVNENIDNFHNRRAQRLSDLTLSDLLEKNPYLFKAKNVTLASELIDGTMSAFLSSSEEPLFGEFLEGLACFIASRTTGGVESASEGIDLEFVSDNVHYIVSIKSGPNWGNADQHNRLGTNLMAALNRLRVGRPRMNADAVLGICYGKTKTARNRKYGYLKLVGQNFWTFISGNQDLYTEIIEPLGYRAREHNDLYLAEHARITNLLTRQFIDRFCTPEGVIDWVRVVQANSGNYDLDQHGFNF
jgi:hypothetical protein